MSLLGDLTGLAAVYKAYDVLGDAGDDTQKAANLIADDVYQKSQFQPFGITTGTTRGTVGQAGDLNLGITGPAAGVQAALFQDARRATGAPLGTTTTGDFGQELFGSARKTLGAAPMGLEEQAMASSQAFDLGQQFMSQAGQTSEEREQEIFNRIRARQLPEEERQRLALEERLYNQGRLGVQTEMFGGTGEQLALAKAQEEARNTAALQAMQQSMAEQAQQAALGSQFTGLGSGLATQRQALEAARQAQGLQAAQLGLGMFAGRQGLRQAQTQMAVNALRGALLPESLALNTLQQGLTASQLAQRAQQFGTGMFGEAKMTGIDAQLAAALGQANLMGNVGSGVLAAGAQGSGGGLFDFLSGLF